MNYINGPLTKDEKDAFARLQESMKGGFTALVRAKLDGKDRAALCEVHSGDDKGFKIYPIAVLLTEEEKVAILDPEGLPTTEDAITDLVENG